MSLVLGGGVEVDSMRLSLSKIARRDQERMKRIGHAVGIHIVNRHGEIIAQTGYHTRAN